MTTLAALSPTALYSTGLAVYRNLGWRSVVPCDQRSKHLRVMGVTGHQASVPSDETYDKWAQTYAGDNVALVMPGNVVGIDVDQYDDGRGKPKMGMTTLAQLEERLGPLPPTWMSTARVDTDGVPRSGIRFYRVPPGTRYKGVAGPCIEVIQAHHRYAVVWPSIHPNGRTYSWYTQSLPAADCDKPALVTQASMVIAPAESLPSPDQLPELPQAWRDFLSVGALSDIRDKLGYSDEEAIHWATTATRDERMCPQLKAYVLEFIDALASASTGSRHDAALTFICDVVRGRVTEGHTGGATALSIGRSHWLEAMSHEPRDVAGEWDRMVAGAARMPFGRDQLWQDIAELHTCVVVPSVDHIRTSQLWDNSRIFLSDNPDEWTQHLDSADYDTWLAQQHTELSQKDPATLTAPQHELLAQKPAEGTLGRWRWGSFTDLITGAAPRIQPHFLSRTDGALCFYPGMVNGIIGPSESAKSWVAMYTVAQALLNGRTVLLMDFEDVPATTLNRLRKLGVPDAVIDERLGWMTPDEGFGPAQRADLINALATYQPDLVVLDGYNNAMVRMGLNPMANEDVIRFSTSLLHLMTSLGTTVVYIDHTAKHKVIDVAGAIGAQAKRADTSGCIIRVEAKIKPAPGQLGRLVLSVDKDRHGGVREHAIMVDGNAVFGEVVMDETDPAVGLRMRCYPVASKKVAEATDADQAPTLGDAPAAPSANAPRLGALSASTAELLSAGTPHRTRGELPPAPVAADVDPVEAAMTADQVRPAKKVARPQLADTSLVHSKPDMVLGAIVSILRDRKNIMPKGDDEWPDDFTPEGRHDDCTFSARDFRRLIPVKSEAISVALNELEAQGCARRDPECGNRWRWLHGASSYPQENPTCEK